MTREQIEAKINDNSESITKLRNENFGLRVQFYKTSDGKQWFTEELETIGRGKKKREQKVGKIHWMQEFTDEDTGEKNKYRKIRDSLYRWEMVL